VTRLARRAEQRRAALAAEAAAGAQTAPTTPAEETLRLPAVNEQPERGRRRERKHRSRRFKLGVAAIAAFGVFGAGGAVLHAIDGSSGGSTSAAPRPDAQANPLQSAEANGGAVASETVDSIVVGQPGKGSDGTMRTPVTVTFSLNTDKGVTLEQSGASAILNYVGGESADGEVTSPTPVAGHPGEYEMTADVSDAMLTGHGKSAQEELAAEISKGDGYGLTPIAKLALRFTPQGIMTATQLALTPQLTAGGPEYIDGAAG
jgi:hypothetical protein